MPGLFERLVVEWHLESVKRMVFSPIVMRGEARAQQHSIPHSIKSLQCSLNVENAGVNGRRSVSIEAVCVPLVVGLLVARRRCDDVVSALAERGVVELQSERRRVTVSP